MVHAAEALSRPVEQPLTRRVVYLLKLHGGWRRPYLRLRRILIEMAYAFFSFSWRIREPYGCAGPRRSAVASASPLRHFELDEDRPVRHQRVRSAEANGPIPSRIPGSAA
jgi:hypothetical protein